jgi:hypothetical protein
VNVIVLGQDFFRCLPFVFIVISSLVYQQRHNSYKGKFCGDFIRSIISGNISEITT